jgi:flagellar hook-basal body complex protein FliE
MADMRVGSITPPAVPATPETPGTGKAKGFGELLGKAVESLNQTQTDAQEAAVKLAAGQGDTAETVVAIQKADIALQFTIQIRNKLLEAYQDIMRMQV